VSSLSQKSTCRTPFHIFHQEPNKKVLLTLSVYIFHSHSVVFSASATQITNIVDIANHKTTRAGEKISHIAFLKAKALFVHASLFFHRIQSKTRRGENDIYIHNQKILTRFTTINIIIGTKNIIKRKICIIAFIASPSCLNFPEFLS
jgi:hypothetical protein